MTADGKLAPANRHFVAFGSKRDQELLLELRTRADAVMAGARTVDLSPVTLSAGGEKYRRLRRAGGRAEENLRVIVSGSGTIDPKAKIFRRRFSPIIILTTARIRPARLTALRALADAVEIFGDEELDFRAACRWLYQQWQVRSLLCEGGGELNAGLLRAGVVDEIYLTICPVIFGGSNAPTLADGEGIARVEDAIPLKLKRLDRVKDELFLIFKVLTKRRNRS